MSIARIPCVVPGCRRTAKADVGREWICGDHWRLTDRELRRRRARLRRLITKTLKQRGSAALVLGWLDDNWWKVWADLKTQAIERGAGL